MTIVIFLISLSLFASDIPEIVRLSSINYEKERNEIKNYKVVQDIYSETKSGNQVLVEKRKQIGYYISPDKFFFFVKEKSINNVQIQIKTNEMEKTTKKEIEWLSQKILSKYEFKVLEDGVSHVHYSVLPKLIFPEANKGEIWINKENGRIQRILKEPIKMPNGFESYKTDIFFDFNVKFQEPSFTRLQATYYENNRKIETKVEVLFSGYQFNVDLNKGVGQ